MLGKFENAGYVKTNLMPCFFFFINLLQFENNTTAVCTGGLMLLSPIPKAGGVSDKSPGLQTQ